MKMIKWIFITAIVLIGIFDYLLILGCAKLESERENDERSRQIDGVTCARYPACDDCPDNPLNKVKGSERLVKGSEVTTDCRQLERSRR
jgi:hypothetical protein